MSLSGFILNASLGQWEGAFNPTVTAIAEVANTNIAATIGGADIFVTPNVPMSGAEARSAKASAQLAGWAAAILLVDLSELP